MRFIRVVMDVDSDWFTFEAVSQVTTFISGGQALSLKVSELNWSFFYDPH